MDYTSSEFDIQKIARYTLLIYAGRTEHQLAIVDEDGNLMLLTVFNPVSPHSQATDILNAPFERVRITCPQRAYTFVPDAVYDERYLNDYASYIGTGIETEQLAVSTISSIAVRNVYTKERLAFHYFTDRFPHAQVVPENSVILDVAGRKLMKKQGTYLGIDIQDSQLGLYCFDKGQFLFYNIFEMADENDLNYHLLHVATGLGVSWEGIHCMLSGKITSQDAYYKVISKYTDQLEFADTARLAGVTMPSELEVHQHHHLTLMGLYKCEL